MVLPTVCVFKMHVHFKFTLYSHKLNYNSVYTDSPYRIVT